jgi:hypothetical protein
MRGCLLVLGFPSCYFNLSPGRSQEDEYQKYTRT